MRSQKSRLNLTPLEDRLTPAVTLSFFNGNLYITGDNTSNNLSITGTGTNVVTVSNNSKGFGSYAATGNIQVTLGNSADTLTVNLGGFSLGGNLTANLGNSNDSVSLGNGTLAGFLNLSTGNGNDSVNVGSSGAFTAAGVVGTVNLGLGIDTFTATNSIFSNTLLLSGASTINFTGTNTVGGSLVVNNNQDAGSPMAVTLSAGTTVNGAVTVVGSAGADSLTLNGVVNGNATFVGGEGANSLSLTGTVNGSLSAITGGGNDTINFAAATSQVSGSVNFYAGNGDNSVTLLGLIYGSVSGTGGGGGDTVTLGGIIDGNVGLNLGNGSNRFNASAAAINGSRLDYLGGGGTDAVTIGGGTFVLNVALGAGIDTFTYTAAAKPGAATLDFGVDIDPDVYIDGGVIVTWNQRIVNFP